jgi:hypothetical protein
MHKLSGKVRVCGTTAYVAQTSWIQNGTVQDNILFGLPMNRSRWCHDHFDPKEHNHPNQEGTSLLHLLRQPTRCVDSGGAGPKIEEVD